MKTGMFHRVAAELRWHKRPYDYESWCRVLDPGSDDEAGGECLTRVSIAACAAALLPNPLTEPRPAGREVDEKLVLICDGPAVADADPPDDSPYVYGPRGRRSQPLMTHLANWDEAAAERAAESAREEVVDAVAEIVDTTVFVDGRDALGLTTGEAMLLFVRRWPREWLMRAGILVDARNLSNPDPDEAARVLDAMAAKSRFWTV